LCKTHYFKRFNEQGNYLGGENFAQKSSRGNTTFTPPAAPASPSVATAAPPSGKISLPLTLVSSQFQFLPQKQNQREERVSKNV
jgi:hypothetical protein